MINIDVPLTKIAPLYYSSIVIAMVLVALYFSDYNIPFGVWLIILMAIIVMILAFLDFSISYDRVRNIIKNIKNNEHDN